MQGTRGEFWEQPKLQIRHLQSNPEGCTVFCQLRYQGPLGQDAMQNIFSKIAACNLRNEHELSKT